MKRFLFGLLLFGLLMACKDDNNSFRNDIIGSHKLCAKIENLRTVDTRISVDTDNRIYWEETDRIGVYATKSQNVLFTYNTPQDDAAIFTGNLEIDVDEANLAYYPYQESAVKDGNKLTVKLPSEYVYNGNSNVPMLGIKVDDGNFLFKYTCGLMRITLGELPEDAECLVITSCGDMSPEIAGKAVINDVYANNAIIKIVEEGSKVVTCHLSRLDKDSSLKYFFIPLPIGDYTKLELSLYGKSSSEAYFTKSVSNLSVHRADLIEMSVINDVTEDGYVLSDITKELTEDVAKSVMLSGTNSDVLIFNSIIPTENIPQVGQIIISKAYDNIPYGFLGQVAEVKKNDDGNYVVKTKQTSLSEAFDKLYVNETVDVISLESDVAQTRSFLQDGIFKDFEIAREFRIDYGLPDSPLYATGTLFCGGNLIININFDKSRKMEYCAMTWRSNVKLEVQAGIHLKSETEIEGLKKALGELKFAQIPLAGGLVQIFPTYVPYFQLKGKGEVISTIGVEAEFQPIVAALYKNGKWESGKNGTKPRANQESPWDFQGHLTFKGKLLAGLHNEFNLKLYNKNNMRVYFAPEVGLELEGNLDVNEQNKDSWEDIIDRTTFHSSLYMSGSVGADASLLGSRDLEAEIEIAKLTFWEKDISVLPLFKKLQANVKPIGENTYESDVATELSGELLSKDVEVELVVVDKEGNEVATSKPIFYNGGKTFEEEPEVVVPLENKFSQLKAHTEYEVYPRITSPIFADIAEGGTIDLKKKSIGFDTHNAIRDVLMKIYNENGGKNWMYQKNWCSDAPVAEWEGVDYMDDGTYKFSFFKVNNLTGVVTIENCSIPILLCESKEVEGLHLVNCPNLRIEKAISDYTNLKQLYIENIKVVDEVITENIDGSRNEKYTFKISDMLFLKNIEIKKCQGKLFYLDVSNCPSLTSLICEDLVFDEQICYNEQFPNVWWKTTAMNISLCESLNTIHCNRISNIGEINLQACSSLKGVSFNQNHFRHMAVSNNCKIENFMVDGVGSRGIDCIIILFGDNDSLEIGCLNFKNVTCKFYECKEIAITTMCFDYCLIEGEHSTSVSFIPHFNENLRSAIFKYCHFSGGVIFDGCSKLEYLSCTNAHSKAYTSPYSAIDIRNTPNLKYFNCSYSDFTDILFDSHFNFVEVHCENMLGLLKLIPDFLNPDNMECFEYDQRFSYRNIQNPITHEYEIEAIDRGYGWWYPGEPESGFHER